MELLTPIGTVLVLAALVVSFAALLRVAMQKFHRNESPANLANTIQHIDALLPQTQCGQCGHPGCKPYAESIASGEAINRCVPGGNKTIKALAQLLNREFVPLDPAYGREPEQKLVAYIREPECIGCTKCIQACPVDAIVGAAKLMHTVIVEDCTGCDLCVEPCPVDCIDMIPLPVNPHDWRWPQPAGMRIHTRNIA